VGVVAAGWLREVHVDAEAALGIGPARSPSRVRCSALARTSRVLPPAPVPPRGQVILLGTNVLHRYVVAGVAGAVATPAVLAMDLLAPDTVLYNLQFVGSPGGGGVAEVRAWCSGL
jgi:hypothetical protein